MTEKKIQIKPYPLGAHRESDKIRFSFVSKKEDCGVILYDRNTGKELKRLAFTQEERLGNVYCKYVEDMDPEKLAYQFYQENHIMPDSYARVLLNMPAYGNTCEEEQLRAGFLKADFNWENDRNPKLPYEQCLCYCMHVRGFTKHTSSKVAHKGTFLGIVEKIPYLKDSGITTIELQPAYEFPEITVLQDPLQEKEQCKLNYWGYQKGFYYAPKSSYASGKDASVEFKTMVKELHGNSMEVVMQFYFPKEVNRGEIAEILRFWVLEYHVDGFHLMGEDLPISLLAKEPVLADTKLWYYSFDADTIYDKNEKPAYCNLAEYRDDYLYSMRRFLKSDENMLGEALQQMRHIPEKTGRIHYLSNYYGLTLMDMVSYDRKHNEENGEDNRDGNDYNCSWNCGEEGTTRKKKVVSLRMKQLKNAMCMLFFSQSTPLIFMGDEFGNSQSGNNNPYCQDNKTTWLDWKELERNRDLYEFWKFLVALRKEHPILRPASALRIMDYVACGYPDLSYHGQTAWRPQLESYNRHIGVMYCGKYARIDRDTEDDFFYVAYNMHWEPHELALPKLPKGLKWQVVCATEEEKDTQKEQVRMIPGRSIVVFKSEVDPAMEQLMKKSGKKTIQKLQQDNMNDRTIF